MKKCFYTFAAVFAAISFTSCQKEVVNNTVEGDQICLFAQSTTRTVINQDWSEVWKEGDNLTVFNAGAGETSYSSRCKFVLTGDPAGGKFVTQESSSLISGKAAYDWYVCYPYIEWAAAPGGTKGYSIPSAYNQVVGDDLKTVATWDIMSGKALNVADGTNPTLTLHHNCAILQFNVTNKTSKATPITSLSLDASDSETWINGSFTMDWSGEIPVLDPTRMGSMYSRVSTVNLVDAKGDKNTVALQPNESISIYVITAPFSLKAGKSVKVTVRGGEGESVISSTMKKDVTFTAGTVSTQDVEYANPEKVLFFDNASGNTVSSKTHLIVYGSNSDRDGVGVTLSNGSAYSSTGTGVSGTAMDGGCWKLSGAKTTSNVKYTGVHVYGAKKIRLSYDIMKTCDDAVTMPMKYRKTGVTSWSNGTSSNPEKNVATHISTDLTLPDNTETIEFYIGASPTGAYPYFDNVKIIDITEN